MGVNLSDRLKSVSALISETTLLNTAQDIWDNARFCTFPRFQKTAKYIHAKLEESGVQARTYEIPADGKTVFADWRMPIGWDCKKAKLEIHDPFEERGRVLADCKQLPCHVIMWSGATPEEGIKAPVIRIADAKDLKKQGVAVKGKIVFTPSDPRGMKKKLFDLGARAVVTSFCTHADKTPDAVSWLHSWSDHWHEQAFHEGCAPLPGIVISPNSGVELEILMDREKVSLKLHIETRYMTSKIPIVHGYLDGPIQEEVMVISRIHGQGANDHASGASVVVEALRALKQGIKSGKLADLKRGIRGILTQEGYGTIGFAASNPTIMQRLIGGLNINSLGRHQEAVDGEFAHKRCPDASASVLDTLIVLLIEAWLPKAVPYAIVQKGKTYSLEDNSCNDPKLGVPCPCIAGSDRYQHTSLDTPESLNGNTLHAWTTIVATYLHFIATATAKEALWLARETISLYSQKMESASAFFADQLSDPESDKPAVLANAFDHLTYLKEIGDKAVRSAQSLMLPEERAQGQAQLESINEHTAKLLDLQQNRLRDLAGCEPGALPALDGIDDIAELRPYKNFIGTPAYNSVPEKSQNAKFSPMFDAPLHCALFWANGEHTFAGIIRKIRNEFGSAHTAELSQHFRFMGDHGLLQWLQPGEAIPEPAPSKDSEILDTPPEVEVGASVEPPDAEANE